MKIAQVSPRYLPSELRGGEQYVRVLSETLSSKHKLTVLASNSTDLLGNLGIPGSYYLTKQADIINNVTVIRFPVTPLVSTTLKKFEFLIAHLSRNYRSYKQLDLLRTLAWGPLTPTLYSHIVSSNYDVVHSVIWPTTTVMISLYACKKSHTPFVITPFYHFRLAEFSQSSLLRWVLRNSSAIIAVTERERTELLKIGAYPNRTFTIPLSLDTSMFPQSNGARFRKEHGLENKFVVLAHPWMSKGAQIVLLAMKELSNIFPNLALVTIGNPDAEYLLMSSSLRNDSVNVIDLGWVSGQQKFDAFACSDVFVMPSLSDAFGMVYLEAWASEKPVIGLRNTAAEDIITHGEDGFLMNEPSVKELVLLLSSLISNSDLASTMGMNGRRRVERDFSPARTCAQFVEAIEYSLKIGLPY